MFWFSFFGLFDLLGLSFSWVLGLLGWFCVGFVLCLFYVLIWFDCLQCLLVAWLDFAVWLVVGFGSCVWVGCCSVCWFLLVCFVFSWWLALVTCWWICFDVFEFIFTGLGWVLFEVLFWFWLIVWGWCVTEFECNSIVSWKGMLICCVYYYDCVYC